MTMDCIAADAWQLPFIPERLTPLSFTPVWGDLLPAEQLRYNQLHGLYFHEQIIFIEQAIIVPLLRAVQPQVADAALRDSLNTFITEENTHSQRFHALLAALRPEWYARDWRYFVRAGVAGDLFLGGMVRHPRVFPFLIWLVQLMEERSIFSSRLYLAAATKFPQSIVAVQRQHLADEADHVQWDLALTEQFWEQTPAWLRRVNTRLLNWMLGEFIAVPRRAALRVIDALATDLPNLSVPPTRLKEALLCLAQQPDFRGAVFGRDAVPRTWKRASAAPDLATFVQSWLSCEHAS